MTDEQADEIYVGVITNLREERLDWIVSEVEVAVRAGKTVAFPIANDESAVNRAQGKRALPAIGHQQRTFTAKERLLLLLDAVDSGVCSPITMESDLVKVLPELEGHEVIFAPGGFTEELPQDLFREGTLRAAANLAGDPLFRPYEPYSLRLASEPDERRLSALRLAEFIQDARRELDADID